MNRRLCSLRLTRRYNAAPAEVWKAVTEADSLRRWLGHVPPLRELEPGRVLELDWTDDSIVRVELATDGDGTRLVLDHRLLEEPKGMAAMSYWTEAMERFPA
jgi:hypothetical protein